MHTHYHQGTPLFIILRDGSTLAGKFKDHKSGCIFLEDGAKIPLKSVRSMSPRKLQLHDESSMPSISSGQSSDPTPPKPKINWRIAK